MEEDQDKVLLPSIIGAVLFSAAGLAVWVLSVHFFGYEIRTRHADFPRIGIVLCGLLAGVGAIAFVGERGIRMASVAVGVAIPILLLGGLLTASSFAPRPSNVELAVYAAIGVVIGAGFAYAPFDRT